MKNQKTKTAQKTPSKLVKLTKDEMNKVQGGKRPLGVRLGYGEY
jgi:hypothetical protein